LLKGALIAVGLLVSVGTGFALYRTGAQELEAANEERFTALMQVRRDALTAFLESMLEETRFWNKNRVMRQALVEFSITFDELGPDVEAELQRLYIDENPFPAGRRDNLERAPDGSRYSQVHARYHYWLRSFLLHRGVYDVFLFEPDGDLVYTSFKERDFATNLNTGEWKDTDLGKALREALDNPFPSYVAFFDFARYPPSGGTPSSFFSSTVLDDDGTLLGVLAFQVPYQRLNEVMQVRAGMGETGETYLVGADLLMRSDSRFSDESTTLKTRVDTATVHLALEGQEGFQITDDYRGIPVYSAYGPVEFEGVRWAVLAEIDVAEAQRPAATLQRTWAVASGLGALVFAAAVLLGLRAH
jgi:methyl-accepting chemotaxis protein